MNKSAMVRARLDPALKDHAEQILHQLGLNASQAITLFYRQVQLHQGLPFAVRIPNETTMETFQATDEGRDLTVCESVDEMFEQLDI